MNILVIIPARGGSKGIPRKNIRTLNGKPLVYYTIKTALNSKYNADVDVYVSSDDDEILAVSKNCGAKTYKRDRTKADDKTTLDPVIHDAYISISQQKMKAYDIIVTLQPTSPLLKTASLDDAISQIVNNASIDTIISVKEDTHLTWEKIEGRYIPNYDKRVNRQFLNPVFKETGGFLITRSPFVTEHNRIGKNIELFLLSDGEDIDIDTYEDWNLCEYYLKRKKILFVVSGYTEIGLGHVYNTLSIANDILNHHIEFLVDKKSTLAYETISSKNYSVHMQKNNNIIDDIKRLSPDVVINDRLDTNYDYMIQLKALGIKKIVNFEDLGEGSRMADLVINAIYPEKEILPGHYFGHKYFALRDEFLMIKRKAVSEKVKKVLITFGGVDPNNYTLKVTECIYDYCNEHGIEINIIAGFGYKMYGSIEKFKNAKVHKNVTNISEYMKESDIIFTSAGRTVFEVTSVCVPTIVLSQNDREMTHFFATKEYGFMNMGLGYKVSKEELLTTFMDIIQSYETRKYMSELMKQVDLKSGRKSIIKLINDILGQI